MIYYVWLATENICHCLCRKIYQKKTKKQKFSLYLHGNGWQCLVSPCSVLQCVAVRRDARLLFQWVAMPGKSSLSVGRRCSKNLSAWKIHRKKSIHFEKFCPPRNRLATPYERWGAGVEYHFQEI